MTEEQTPRRVGSGGIDPELLRTQITRIEALEGDKAEIGADVSEEKKALKDYGGHMQAATLCIRLRKLDVAKRASFLREFDSYRHILGLDDQPDFFDGDESAIGHNIRGITKAAAEMMDGATYSEGEDGTPTITVHAGDTSQAA